MPPAPCAARFQRARKISKSASRPTKGMEAEHGRIKNERCIVLRRLPCLRRGQGLVARYVFVERKGLGHGFDSSSERRRSAN